ncbi:MAG: hypothetical protein ACK5LO_15110 [Leucobacter sp.]
MFAFQRGRGARHRVLGLATAVAVALGFVAVGPAAAQAAAFDQSISGTVSFKADKKFKVGLNHGYLSVLGTNCIHVDSSRYQLSWKGNAYTVKFAEAGSYKISYSPYNKSSKAPFEFAADAYAGSKPTDCKQAKAIKVGASQKVTKRDINLVANGMVQAGGIKLKSGESLAFFDAKSGKLVASQSQASGAVLAHAVAPGTYKAAKVRFDYEGGVTAKVLQVFGGSSKSLGKGTTVTVKAAKGLKLNWPKGTAASAKSFKSSATVTWNGDPNFGKVGKKITAKVKGFPKGTKLSYKWINAKGATVKGAKLSYTPKTSDAGGAVSLSVTASHPKYLTKLFFRVKYIDRLKLKQKSAQKVNGSTASSLTVQAGTKLSVTKATYDKSAKVTYRWYVDNHWASSGSGSSFTPPDDAKSVRLDTTYSRTGYATMYKTVNITITPAAPAETPAPDTGAPEEPAVPPAPDAEPQETVPGDGGSGGDSGGDAPDGETPDASDPDPSESPSSEQPDADRPSVEQPDAEQPGPDQPEGGAPAADTPADSGGAAAPGAGAGSADPAPADG